jgi:protein-tyrosine-phosphatase
VSRRSLERRAEIHAVLADPVRLAVVDDLALSDRAPVELGQLLGIESNLLAHHLNVLERAGLVERSPSHGDGRRRYVRLRRKPLDGFAVGRPLAPQPALFVCTGNSARSQLAAALWSELTGASAASAGTHPADAVHPGAVSAAARAGLDLGSARPRALSGVSKPRLVVTVCDAAHEELGGTRWLHWSIADPVPRGTSAAFDAVVREVRERITAIVDTGAAA